MRKLQPTPHNQTQQPRQTIHRNSRMLSKLEVQQTMTTKVCTQVKCPHCSTYFKVNAVTDGTWAFVETKRGQKEIKP